MQLDGGLVMSVAMPWVSSVITHKLGSLSVGIYAPSANSTSENDYKHVHVESSSNSLRSVSGHWVQILLCLVVTISKRKGSLRLVITNSRWVSLV
jgi:hypothetical protein